MDISHSLRQLFFACFCFGVMYDYIDRRHASDNGHLLEIYYYENMFVNCLHIFRKSLYNRLIWFLCTLIIAEAEGMRIERQLSAN